MTDTALAASEAVTAALPGAGEAYVLSEGEGLCHLVAGQVIHTLAGTEQTAGGFGAVVCDCPLDPIPIPMHWHEREHDTWFCTRGRLQIWCGEQSRVLTPGDFAYVRPGDTHSYRSVAPRTRFFGIVAPGGWEQFFADAGEVWGMTALPPVGRPFDFARMGPAMAKHRIMRVENPIYAEASPMGEADQCLPEDGASYFLDAGYGPRHHLGGHLVTDVLTHRQCAGQVEIRMVEAGQGAESPMVRHERTHMFLYLLDGGVEVSLNGKAYAVSAGDAVNIPAGHSYGTRVISGAARWLACSAGGNGGAFWTQAGTPTDAFCFACDAHEVDPSSMRQALTGIDAAI